MTSEPLWLDDIEEGMYFESEELKISRDEIISFARAFDPQPFYLDQEVANASPFKGLVASNWHTCAIWTKLLLRSKFSMASGIVYAGANIRWMMPVRPSDTLRLRVEITGVRKPVRSDRGVIMVHVETLNQHHEIVLALDTRLIGYKRPLSHRGQQTEAKAGVY